MTVGLQIDPGDQFLPEQEGKYVVPVLALGLRHVDFDAIVKPEEPLRAASLPDQRVEGGQQRSSFNAAREMRLRMQEGRFPPTLDLYLMEKLFADQPPDLRPHLGHPQPEVVRKIPGSRHSTGASRDEDELPGCCFSINRGSIEHVGREDPFGQVIDLGECRRPVRNRQSPLGVEPVQRDGPAPHPPPGSRPLPRVGQIGIGEWAPGGYFLVDPFDVPRVTLHDLLHPVPRPGRLHPGTHERKQICGAQRCGVEPVLEQFTTLVGRFIQQRARVRTQSGKQRQVVGAFKHVDRVDLENRHSRNNPTEVADVDPAGGRRVGKTLGSESDPASLSNREFLAHARSVHSTRRPSTLAAMLAALRTPFTYLLGLLATGLAATAIIVVSTVSPSSRLVDRIARGWARVILWAGGVRLRVTGTEHVDPSTSYVVISNHQSTFDIMAHFLALPIPIRFLAKQELFRVPLLGWALRRLNMVPVDRFAGRTVYAEVEQNAATTVAHGNSIIVYPEGTRTRDGDLLPFKNGAFFIAVHTGLPILPTTIAGSFEAWLPRAKIIKGGTITVAISAPVTTRGVAINDTSQLREEIRAGIADTLRELQAPGGKDGSAGSSNS